MLGLKKKFTGVVVVCFVAMIITFKIFKDQYKNVNDPYVLARALEINITALN